MTTILEVDNLCRRFGAVQAVAGISFHVRKHEILGIVGPNGSGKTTLFNCITGFLRSNGGKVHWLGHDITHWDPNSISRSGLVRTFQQTGVFPTQTVRSNVLIAKEAQHSIGRPVPKRPEKPAGLPHDVDEILEFVGLQHLASVSSGMLAYGQSRLLGLAIALAAQPTLLMLDEPSSGLNDTESRDLAVLLQKVRDAGVTLCVIDHDMHFLMPVSDRVMAMDAGQKIAEGPPDEVQRDPTVIRVYLGDKFESTQSSNPPTQSSAYHPGATQCPLSGPGRPSSLPSVPGDVQGVRLLQGRGVSMSLLEGLSLFRRFRRQKPLGPPDQLRLELEDVHVWYGATYALNGINIHVEPGEVVAVLGPNGAGKTTMMSAISGVVPVKSGQIRYGSRSLIGLKPHQIVMSGVAHSPEGRRIFGRMSAADNMRIGALHRRVGARVINSEIEGLLDTFPLTNRMNNRGSELSGGQQQMLAIARALMAQPTLLLMDEPSLGLSPLLISQTTELIAKVRRQRNMSIFLAEQNASMALELADRVYIIRNGRIVHEDSSRNLSLEVVLEAYLGSTDSVAEVERPDHSEAP